LSGITHCQIFKAMVIRTAREMCGDNETATALLDAAEPILLNASESIIDAQELLVSNSVYESAKALDRGISTFTALVERQDMTFLLEI
jgi:hypothetical protein